MPASLEQDIKIGTLTGELGGRSISKNAVAGGEDSCLHPLLACCAKQDAGLDDPAGLI